MSETIKVIEENVRPYINNVYLDYLILPDRELKVWMGLKSFAWNHKENCYPSIPTLSKLVKKSQSQVREILRILESKGLIRTEHCTGKSSIYYITNKILTTETKPRPHRKSGAHPTGNPVPTPPEIRCLSNIKNITKEKERDARKRACSLPKDFVLNDESKKLCQDKGINAESMLTKFKALAKDKAWKSADWQAKFQLIAAREYKEAAPKAPTIKKQPCKDEKYTPCSVCQRPKLHCECNYATREQNAAHMAKLKDMMKGKLLNK